MKDYLSYTGDAVYNSEDARKRVASDFVRQCGLIFGDRSCHLSKNQTQIVMNLRDMIISGALSSGDAYKVMHSYHKGQSTPIYNHYLYILDLNERFDVPYSHFSQINPKKSSLWQNVVKVSTTVSRSVVRACNTGFDFIRDYVML